MNRSPAERQLREVVQRTKAADLKDLPSFDDVLRPKVRTPERHASRRRRLGLAACTAAAMLFAVLILWRSDGSWLRPAPDVAGHTKDTANPRDQERAIAIDFERLHFEIEKQFAAYESPDWPTRTDDLLAINLDIH